MAELILGLTGEMASGKGTAAKYLEEKYGAGSHRFSTPLRNVLERLYLEKTRENLQKISSLLRREFGEDMLAKIIFHDVKNDQKEIVVIDGVRRLEDIARLRELPHFKLVYIETSLEKRYERIIQRTENVDDKNKTLEQFKKEQKQEAELQIRGLKQDADFVVVNDATISDLHKQIDRIIKECKD